MSKKSVTTQDEPKRDPIAEGANAALRASRGSRSLTLVDNFQKPANRFMGDFIRMNSKRGLELTDEEAKALAKAEAEFDAEAEDGGERRRIDANAGSGTGTAPSGRRQLDVNERMRNLVAWLDVDLADVSTMAGINPRNLLFGHGPAVRANALAELVWWEPADTGPYVSAAQVGPFHYRRNH